MEWVATGRVFSAEEAQAGGLVRSVHPQGELLGAAHALAREIADNAAPVSVALARRLLWTMLGAEHPMEAHRADSRAMFSRGQSDDAREGVTSFLEKREAQFTDRVSDGLPEILPGRDEPAFSVSSAAARARGRCRPRCSLAVHAQRDDRPGADQRRMPGELDAAVEAAPRRARVCGTSPGDVCPS